MRRRRRGSASRRRPRTSRRRPGADPFAVAQPDPRARPSPALAARKTAQQRPSSGSRETPRPLVPDARRTPSMKATFAPQTRSGTPARRRRTDSCGARSCRPPPVRVRTRCRRGPPRSSPRGAASCPVHAPLRRCPPQVASRVLEGSRPLRTHALEGEGEHPCERPVPPRRERDLERRARSAVQLGRTPRARPSSSREPPVRDVEETRLGELVQVERSEGAAHADGVRGLVAPDLAALRGHVVVQGPTRGFAQQRDRRDLLRVSLAAMGRI